MSEQSKNTMTDENFNAYVAGFLDGEGYLQLIRRTRGKRRYIQKAVKFTNTNEEVLVEIQRVFGGIISGRPAGRLGRTVFKLEIWSTEDIQILLRAVLPFLRIKRNHAELLLRFLERPRGSKSTSDEYDLCAQMTILNRQSRWIATTV